MGRKAENTRGAARRAVTAAVMIIALAVAVAGYAAIAMRRGWGMPCLFRTLTGWQCPGCGMTRAAYLLMHGHPIAALRQNPFILVVLMAGYMGIAELSPYLFGRQLKQIVLPSWLLIALGALLIVFCIARNIGKFL